MTREKNAEKGERISHAPLAKKGLSESGVVIRGGKPIMQVPLRKYGSLHKSEPGKAPRRENTKP